jgi:hypothetical protein
LFDRKKISKVFLSDSPNNKILDLTKILSRKKAPKNAQRKQVYSNIQPCQTFFSKQEIFHFAPWSLSTCGARGTMASRKEGRSKPESPE